MYPVNRREQEVFITYSVCDFVVHGHPDKSTGKKNVTVLE